MSSDATAAERRRRLWREAARRQRWRDANGAVVVSGYELERNEQDELISAGMLTDEQLADQESLRGALKQAMREWIAGRRKKPSCHDVRQGETGVAMVVGK